MRRGKFSAERLFSGAALLGLVISGCLRHEQPPAFTDDLFNLRLTEIHYNPADCGVIDGDSLEFIELKNVGDVALNLEGVEFTLGVDYKFPLGTVLQPGQFYVIASSRKKFEECYHRVPDGEYDGQLRNSGDTIEVRYFNTGAILIHQPYADSGAWPGAADGNGYSLVTVKSSPGRGETDPGFWRSSTEINGSPGADDLTKPLDSALLDLRITEIQYHPLYTNDTIGEDSLEFIELKNTGGRTISLADVEFVKGIDYAFPAGATLAPGAFLVLASNAAWFERRYDSSPYGTYGGQLRNSGETLEVADVKAAITLLSIAYSDANPWPKKADGDGWSLVPQKRNPGRSEQNNPAAWRPSFRINGSPGRDDPGVVLVNEVLPHTDLPDLDAIELYNPGDAEVNISGWFLTDKADQPVKFRIPDGVTIPADGYRVFTSDDFNRDSTQPGSFALSEFGDEAYVMADAAGCGGYCHGCSFGAMERGVSYGRYIVPSTGNEVFVPLRSKTLGEANTGPLVGPLVISEIMHQPQSGKAQYIEITNISDKGMSLFDPDYPQNTWRVMVDDVYFQLPKGMSLKSKASIVIAFTMDDAGFRTGYGIDADIPVLFFSGTLPDPEAKIRLERPLPPEKDANGAVIRVDFMECEKIYYKNQAPWPAGTNATGLSLTRINSAEFGNDPANWKAATSSPGKAE